VAAIRIGEPSSGFSEIQVMELIPGLDYRKFQKLMELFLQQSGRQTLMSKDSFHQLLSFAQGRRERETLTPHSWCVTMSPVATLSRRARELSSWGTA